MTFEVVCVESWSARLPKDKLRKDHWKMLKELRSLEDEVILPANKGNAMVVMRSDYDEKVRGMLDDTITYRKLKDPTATQETRIVRTLLHLHSNGELTKCLYNGIRLNGSCLPRIYGLPKIHKPHIPQRPHLCSSCRLLHGVLRGAGTTVSSLETEVLEAVCG